ncbi:hypothetical protein PFICI_04331 [Pestalotiopsis fici W106-1]|uniref:Hydroxyneurosporene synthase n=1 Tax=Pestalotiopsis fici (strain W106-1 / CGMCC3.15140) TaxID=1229662 RepID=W3X8T6_PESFW|nr:uncharacterized protein PFICI_04331 [Pestalotiopsis fici W106-1]ETS82455.1 hypothetical protein PFICI_04331 [Pestalotiopsis fici W106-1]
MARYVSAISVLLGATALGSGSAAKCGGNSSTTYAIPLAAATGAVDVEFTSTNAVPDAPKLSAINSSSFDWWYFDTVSRGGDQGLAILFNAGLSSGLLGGNNETVPYFSISGLLENGEYLNYVAWAEDDGAIITTGSDGSSKAVWTGTGGSWVATANMGTYTISVNAPQVNGTISFKSVAPAHNPCGPIQTGSDLLVAPSIGWTNPLPDADISVDLVTTTGPVKYSGVGYHDKNWGSQLFPSTFNSWYWGHARAGAYSVVWFEVLAPSNDTHYSGYLAKDGQILHSACGAESITVRPLDTAYPRGDDESWPSGYTIEMEIGEQKELFTMTVTNVGILNDAALAHRYVGTANVFFHGEEFSGIGQWEELWLPYV